jgi:hypothetical protein
VTTNDKELHRLLIQLAEPDTWTIRKLRVPEVTKRIRHLLLLERIDQLQADILLAKNSLGAAELGLMQERLAELKATISGEGTE